MSALKVEKKPLEMMSFRFPFSNPLQDSIVPRPFQMDGVTFLRENNYCILGDEMGLGKSLQMLYHAIETCGNTLVVCPSYLRLNWFREIDKLSRYLRRVAVIENERELRECNPKNYDIIIMGYNLIVKAAKLFEWSTYVIADEAHYLKDIRTTWTRAFHREIYECEPDYVNLGTGTIMPNGITELYSPLRLCGYSKQMRKRNNVYQDFEDPRDFYDTFGHRKHNGFGTIWEGSQNIPMLKQYMKECYLSRKQSEVLSDLPTCHEQEVMVNYIDEPELEAEWKKHNDSEDYKSKAKAKSALRKAPFTAKFAQNLIDQGIPIAVYSAHRDSIAMIAEKLEVPCIMGGMSSKRRLAIEKAFQAGEIPAFCGTIGAAGTGLNLTKAQALIKNDLEWVPSKNWQADKRMHRYGQLHETNVYNMIGSIQDERIVKNLTKKIEVIREIA